MNKRFEDYSREELTEAILHPIEREKLVNHILKEVEKILNSMLTIPSYREKSDDFINDAYVELIKNIENGKFKWGEEKKTNPLKALKSYWAIIAYQIACNLSRKKESKELSLEGVVIEIADSEGIFLAEQLVKDEYLYIALEKLGENCKSIIKATEMEGKSYEEVMADAEIMAKTGRTTLLSLRDLKRTCMKKLTNFLLNYFDEKGNLKA